jgi:Gpi18-like mannosyltransferase
MLVAGIYSVWKGPEWSAAVWFGLAAALKAPAGLFLAFLLWKRHWRVSRPPSHSSLIRR